MTKTTVTPRHAEVMEIALSLVKNIHALSKILPEKEDMVMVPELRTAAMDLQKAAFMAAHVDNREDFLAYTDDVRGKAARLDTYVQLARDLGYCDEAQYAAITQDIEKICDLIEPPAKPLLKLVE